MKCERCHQADAATVIHVKENGEDRELFVCKACANAERDGPRKEKRSATSRPVVGDGEPPPFVKNLLEATLGFMQGVADTEKTANLKCPKCKRTWDQIKDERRLGCPACWTAFSSEIPDAFLRGAYAAAHIGSIPPDVQGEDSRKHLERALKSAVAREDFEKAARIKRRLDALGGGNGTDA